MLQYSWRNPQPAQRLLQSMWKFLRIGWKCLQSARQAVEIMPNLKTQELGALMAADYLPHREADLVQWSRNYSEKINADAISFGLTPAQAAQYAARHDAFAALYALAQSNSTRTPTVIVSKNQAKRELEIEARRLTRIIKAYPQLTIAQRVGLGISVRDPGGADTSQVPVPEQRIRISVINTLGNIVRVRLSDPDSRRRGKPAGVAGASVFGYIGELPPAELADWEFMGNTTRPVFNAKFPHRVQPGTKIWLTARWFNPRAQPGPACQPIYTHIQYGSIMMAA